MSEEVVVPIPNLQLAQCLFVLSNAKLAHLHDKARKELIEGITADEMGPWYRSITSPSPSSSSASSSSSSSSSAIVPLDNELLKTLEEKNAAELQKLDERLEEAKKQDGESEISEVIRARASYLTKIGDKDRALEALNLALEKSPGVGSRIDIVLTIVRLGFFFSDNSLVTEHLAKAEKLIDEGGDWDRRNRLKVYTALHHASIRQFKPAADLFLDALSTFTATELLSFNEFVAMAVICGVLTCGRGELKKRIMSAPEVNQVLPEQPVLGDLFKNLYESHYDKFFAALATLEQTHLLPSRYLSPHTRFYTREMRILAYTQLLESYRSLTMDSLARAFGVSKGFIDRELSHYISTARIHARIDKVHELVETTRPERRQARFEGVVKRGDVILNEVQRLSKVLH